MALSFTKDLTKAQLSKLNDIIKNIELIKKSGEQHKSAQIILIRMYRLCCKRNNRIKDYFDDALIIEGIYSRNEITKVVANHLIDMQIPTKNGQTVDSDVSSPLIKKEQIQFKHLINDFSARDAYVALDSKHQSLYRHVPLKSALNAVNDVLGDLKHLASQLSKI